MVASINCNLKTSRSSFIQQISVRSPHNVYAVDTLLFYNRFIFLESYAILILGLAFRMESLFRLLLHEQSLVHEEHSDPKLLLSIDYHRRDLATTLETAKWQVVINVDSPHPLFVCFFFFFFFFFFF